MDWLFYIAVTCLILTLLFRRKSRRTSNVFFLCFFLIAFSHLLPESWLPKKNIIKNVAVSDIQKIQLTASKPSWKVNLTSGVMVLQTAEQIDTIASFLQDVQFFIPEHPYRVWETKLIMHLKNGDSTVYEIHQTMNNGTLIYFRNSSYRNDLFGHYLEQIASYETPQYGWENNK